jgi:hypothetical protein
MAFSQALAVYLRNKFLTKDPLKFSVKQASYLFLTKITGRMPVPQMQTLIFFQSLISKLDFKA